MASQWKQSDIGTRGRKRQTEQNLEAGPAAAVSVLLGPIPLSAMWLPWPAEPTAAGNWHRPGRELARVLGSEAVIEVWSANDQAPSYGNTCADELAW